MENAPIIPEIADDDKDSKKEKDSKSKKKGRKGYGLGGFTFELDKSDDDKDDKKEKSWFSFLEKDDDKDGKKDKNEKPSDEGKDRVADKPESSSEVSESESAEASSETGAENLESEAPVEEISDTEASEIRPKIIEAIETVEKDGVTDPDTDAPVEEFREIVKETGDADKAYEQVLSELNSNPEEAEEVLGAEESQGDEAPVIAEFEAETADAEATETDSEAVGEEAAEVEDNELREGDEILLNAPENTPELDADEAGEDEPDSTDTSTSGGTPAGTQTGSSSRSTAGGGTRPPHVPPAPSYGTFSGPPPGPNINAAPAFAAANPNAAPQQQDPEYYYGASPAAMALFGGIIGYLIGRRRGRIKTEKKLIPIQKKLEKQVENLRFDIQEKEKTIRRVAAEKIKTDGPAIIERFKETERERSQKPTRIKAPEATELHGSNKHHERIGHVIVTKEAAPEIKTSKTDSGKAKEEGESKQLQNNFEVNRDVETLSRNELLEIGDKIIVNGTSLRQIYESHLIGERGLRRLVHEHLRGGDMAKALKMEIAERELDFERDPMLRDMNPHQYGGGGGSPVNGTSKVTLEHLLKKADAALEDTSEEAAYYKARAAFEAKQYQKKQQNRQVLDVTLAVVITSLIATILYLIITKI